ncbi:hypothetical protein MHYP_G00177310 [Metynnis hypsauchen]
MSLHSPVLKAAQNTAALRVVLAIAGVQQRWTWGALISVHLHVPDYSLIENVTRGNLEVPRGDNSTSVGRLNRRNREVTDRGVDVVDEGESRSRVEQNQHTLTAQLEEFDNYLDDMEPEEEPLHGSCQDVSRLPGEVEEDLPVYTPSFCHHTLLELSSTAKDHMAHTPQTTDECQSETEEVVPFSLDDTFDYDNVVLSHKHPTQHITSGSS